MKVQLDLDDELWWLLLDRAENRNRKVADLVTFVLTKWSQGKYADPSHLNKGVDTLLPKVALLVTAGLSDQKIADALGCSTRTVASKRQTLGLAPSGQQPLNRDRMKEAG